MTDLTDITGNRPLFDLGAVVATPAALEACEEAKVSPSELHSRHVRGDWGDIPPEDRRKNERSLKYDWRVLSSYRLGEEGARVWIITEASRESTCLLLPSEY